jgi:hypothetical protein
MILGAGGGGGGGGLSGAVGFGAGAAAAAGAGAYLGSQASEPAMSNAVEPLDPSGSAGHDTGARESTRGKHEAGDSRRKRDRGGESGDDRRDWPRKKPDGWKGAWPPKNTCP